MHETLFFNPAFSKSGDEYVDQLMKDPSMIIKRLSTNSPEAIRWWLAAEFDTYRERSENVPYAREMLHRCVWVYVSF